MNKSLSLFLILCCTFTLVSCNKASTPIQEEVQTPSLESSQTPTPLPTPTAGETTAEVKTDSSPTQPTATTQNEPTKIPEVITLPPVVVKKDTTLPPPPPQHDIPAGFQPKGDTTIILK